MSSMAPHCSKCGKPGMGWVTHICPDASTASQPIAGTAEAFPRVAGRCPMGCGETLFLGAGGRVTCSWIACPNLCAADALMATGAL